MIKNTLLFLVLIQTIVLSQNLDSLYNKLLGLKPKLNIKVKSVQTINTKPEKCGFGLIGEIKTHLKEFSLEQQQTIQQILSRPIMQTSLVSPSGFFRIHYDTTGNNKPEYDINELAVAFDSSYNYEVNILSYLAPPKDGSNGGDDKYDVYVEDLRGGDYGATTSDESLGNNKHTSYINLDNSFSTNEGYNSFGISAAQVTAAHEFHHAIQIGNYIFNQSDTYYHELTSTAMEETVYDNVNDYYAYIRSYFNTTSKSFTKQSGYNLALWNIYLHERFDGNTGDEIIKRSWELMATPHNNSAAVAIAKSIEEFGYSFKSEFNKFGIWIYFTNNRTKENIYFEEAKNYPLLKSTTTTTLEPTNMPLTIGSNPISINYNRFLDNSEGLPDTLIAILSNSDVNSTSSIDYKLTVATNTFDGATEINENYFSKIEGNSVDYISDSYIVNNELASDFVESTEIEYAYPQPFSYQSLLSIPTFTDISGKAQLNVYTSDMNLVYSDVKNIAHSGNIVVKWNGLNANNNKLASGVYIYVTKADDKIKKGKIVILNE
ncbi:MAG: MXAN_6640 family putative metalloprotease [Melioribacteraceae bacterium]